MTTIITIEAFNFSHDVNGNPTATYKRLDTGEQTKRRRQVGYSDDRMQGAQLMWRDIYDGELVGFTGSRSEGLITAEFKVSQ